MDALKITITPTFAGMQVNVGAGPSARDPFVQDLVREVFASLDEALDSLPRLARAEIERRKPEGTN